MSQNRFARLGICLLAGLTLASCGGKKAAGKDVLPAINFTAIDTSKVEVTTLKIGMECDYAPFNWTDQNSSGNTLKIANAGGYADGYDVQIARLLGRALDIPVEIYAEKWDSLITDVQNDAINMVIAGMTDTAERRESIAFTDEYYHSEVVLLAKKDVAKEYEGTRLGSSALKTLLAGKNVVSQKDTVEDDMIDSFVTDYGCYHAAAQSTYGLAAQDVANNIADFLTVELPVAQAYVSSMKNVGIIRINQDVISEYEGELGVSIGIKKENVGLQAALNAALAQINSDTRNQIMTAAVERSGE